MPDNLWEFLTGGGALLFLIWSLLNAAKSEVVQHHSSKLPYRVRPEELGEIFLQPAIFKQLKLMLDAEQIEYLLSLPPDRGAVYLSSQLNPKQIEYLLSKIEKKSQRG